MKRYTLTMTNKNGYTIKHSETSVNAIKQFAKFYPLSSFFAWIYDRKEDKMIFQNIYSEKWKKCNNETFTPYY
jgi:uncharacterized membrane protein YkgB